MRKMIAWTLVLVTMSFGIPSLAHAQPVGTAQLATISGEAVDAAGHTLVGQRVDLIENGQVVQTITTGTRGEFSFVNVKPGEYIVRMTINGQNAGMRVVATAGQVSRAVIVAPSAAAPSAAFLAALGLLGGTLVGAAIVAAVVTTVVVVTGS